MAGAVGDRVVTMRAAVQKGPRQMDVVDFHRPRLEPGTAIVRVRAAGICGSDLHPYRHRREAQQRPDGHEAMGEIVEIAPHPGAPLGLREGDRVTLDTICLGRACGACAWCAEGAPFHCQNKRSGADWTGAFADYIKRDVRGLFALPPSVSNEEGALVEPLAVAVHALRLAGLQPGQTVAVIGAGTIGLTTLITAVAMGAGALYMLARHPHQVALSQELGATEALAGTPEETAAAIKERTSGRGVDLVVETVGGAAPTFDQALTLVRRKGSIAMLGVFGERVPASFGKALGLEAQVCFAVCYGAIDGVYDYQVAIDLIASGKAPVGKLLTHRFPLSAAPEAFATADDKASGAVKVQIFP